MEINLTPRRANDLFKRCFLVNSGIWISLFILESYIRILGECMKVYVLLTESGECGEDWAVEWKNFIGAFSSYQSAESYAKKKCENWSWIIEEHEVIE